MAGFVVALFAGIGLAVAWVGSGGQPAFSTMFAPQVVGGLVGCWLGATVILAHLTRRHKDIVTAAEASVTQARADLAEVVRMNALYFDDARKNGYAWSATWAKWHKVD